MTAGRSGAVSQELWQNFSFSCFRFLFFFFPSEIRSQGHGLREEGEVVGPLRGEKT